MKIAIKILKVTIIFLVIIGIAGWPWIFLVNVPVGVLAVAADARGSVEEEHRTLGGLRAGGARRGARQIAGAAVIAQAGQPSPDAVENLLQRVHFDSISLHAP